MTLTNPDTKTRTPRRDDSTTPEAIDIAPQTAQAVRSFSRGRLLIALAVSVVLATVGSVAWVLVSRDRALTAVTTAYEQAASGLAAVLAEVDGAVAAAEPLTGLGEQVIDPTTITELERVIATATALPAAPATDQAAPWRSWDTDRLQAGASDLAESETAARQVSTDLTAATRAVTSSHEAWATADRDAALSDLTAVIDSASAVLAASDGKVIDPAVRDTLAAEIAAATEALDGTTPTDTDGLIASAATAREHATTIAGATQAVTDAQAAWEAEQARIATEQAAAAPSAKATTSTGKNGSTTSTPRSPNSTKSSNPGSGSPAPTTPQEDNRTADDIIEGGSCIAGDAYGNTWSC